MAGRLKLIVVSAIILIAVVTFNYQQQYTLANLPTPIIIVFIIAMAIIIWKLEPILSKGYRKSVNQNNLLNKKKTGNFKKFSYKNLRIISLEFLFFAMMLNLFGYYHTYSLSQKDQYFNNGIIVSEKQQMLSQQIQNDVLLLHLNKDRGLHKIYRDELSASLAIFKEQQDQLEKNIYKASRTGTENIADLQQFMATAATFYRLILNDIQQMMDEGAISSAVDSGSSIKQMAYHEKQFLIQLKNITTQYRLIDNNTDKKYLQTNTVIFASMAVALILITWFVLIPALHTGNKTHSELQELLKGSKQSEALLRTIIDSTPDLIFVKNKKHQYQIVNQAFADQSNTTIESYINKTDIDMGLPEDVVYGNPSKGIRGFWEDDDEVMASGQSKIEYELPVKLYNWNKIVTTVKVPLKDELGKVWGILSFVHDITELKAREEELRKIDKLLYAVATSTYELIRNHNLENAMGTAGALLGTNLHVDKVNIYKNITVDGLNYSDQLVSWNSDDNTIQYSPTEFQQVPVHFMRQPIETLLRDEVFCCGVDELIDSQTREWFENKSIVSVAAFPIFIMNRFWGFVSFNDCKSKREWKDFEFSILRAFASTLGAVIERREIEQQLTIAKNEAEHASKIKSQFMANISHELRTPMNGIIGFNELLLTTELQEKQREYLKNINKSAQRLLLVINDILDLSKIETGELLLINSDFSLINLMQELVNTFALKSNAKNLQFLYTIDPLIPTLVKGDASRISQIVFNLIDNAIKFTEAGEVVLTVKKSGSVSTNQSAKNLQVLISVRDTGIGIDAEKLEQIFESFTQGDISSTRRYGGNGLGLSISKSLAQLMGGRISVTSEPGQGSTFELNLSLEIVEKDVNLKSPPFANGTKEYTGSDVIMVAEDDPMNMMLISEVLKKMGYKVIGVSNGKEALDRIEQLNPAFVFMDVNMPVMDGIAATGLIRKLPQPYGDIPIVALSADVQQEDIDKCLAAGMNDFIPKPFRINDIAATLKTYIEIS